MAQKKLCGKVENFEEMKVFKEKKEIHFRIAVWNITAFKRPKLNHGKFEYIKLTVQKQVLFWHC